MLASKVINPWWLNPTFSNASTNGRTESNDIRPQHYWHHTYVLYSYISVCVCVFVRVISSNKPFVGSTCHFSRSFFKVSNGQLFKDEFRRVLQNLQCLLPQTTFTQSRQSRVVADLIWNIPASRATNPLNPTKKIHLEPLKPHNKNIRRNMFHIRFLTHVSNKNASGTRVPAKVFLWQYFKFKKKINFDLSLLLWCSFHHTPHPSTFPHGHSLE